MLKDISDRLALLEQNVQQVKETRPDPNAPRGVHSLIRPSQSAENVTKESLPTDATQVQPAAVIGIAKSIMADMSGGN